MESWEVTVAIGAAMVYLAIGLLVARWVNKDVAGDPSVNDSVFALVTVFWWVALLIGLIGLAVRSYRDRRKAQV